jgi:hypothetical protein
LITIKLWRLAGVVVTAALFTGVAGASVADNHQTFTDRVSDGSTPYAPDVASLDVTSADNGQLAFRLALNEPGGTFYIGDDISIFIDSDMNANDGISGFDTVLEAKGVTDSPTSGHMEYNLCNFQSQTSFSCDRYADGAVKEERTGANSHAVTFPGSAGNWFTLRVVVLAEYADPNNPTDTTRQGTDRAPDTGAYQYDVRADGDSDGVAGTADLCPRFTGGKFDAKGNGQADGCPPFFPVPNYTFRGSRFGNSVVFSRLSVPNAPGGSTVTLRAGGRVVHRSGPGALPGIAGHSFRVGTTFTFIYSSPNYFGRYKVARVSPAGLSVVRSGCTPPGKTTFIDCKKVKG